MQTHTKSVTAHTYSTVSGGVGVKYCHSDSYRFGFQGQEAENQLYGLGNASFFKYRISDNRIGRFFAIDPLFAEYPSISHYAFCENRVIDGIDLEGLQYGSHMLNWVAFDRPSLGSETAEKLTTESGKQALMGMGVVSSALAFGAALPAAAPYAARGLLGAQSFTSKVSSTAAGLVVKYPQLSGAFLEGLTSFATPATTPALYPFISKSYLPLIGGALGAYMTSAEFSQGIKETGKMLESIGQQMENIITPTLVPSTEYDSTFAPAVSTGTKGFLPIDLNELEQSEPKAAEQEDILE